MGGRAVAAAVAFAVAFELMACGSDVSVSTGSNGGADASAVPSASSSSAGGSGQGGDLVGSGAAGGGPPLCEGMASVWVEPIGESFSDLCRDGWGSDATSCAVGYYELAGPVGQPLFIIEGCGPEARAPRGAFRLAVAAEYEQPGTFPDADITVGIYWTSPRGSSVTVTRVGEVGGLVEGSFDTVLNQLDLDLVAHGTFRVLRAPDLALP